jgi:hypothetical protein
MADENDLRDAVLSVRSVLWIVVALLVVLLAVEAIPLVTAVRAARAASSGSQPSPSPTAAVAEVKRGSSGSIRTTLGYGIVLNKESSLDREWVVVNPSDVPAAIVGPAGLVTTFNTGSYRYKVAAEVESKEPLTAIEISFLTFDVWGNHDRNLATRNIVDFGPGRRVFDGEWTVGSENEASEFYASIAFISRVRTKAGRVIVADVAPIVEEARKFSARFSASDIEPVRPPSPSPAS